MEIRAAHSKDEVKVLEHAMNFHHDIQQDLSHLKVSGDPPQIFGLFASWQGYCMGFQIPIKTYVHCQKGEIVALVPYWVPRNAKLVGVPNDISKVQWTCPCE